MICNWFLNKLQLYNYNSLMDFLAISFSLDFSFFFVLFPQFEKGKRNRYHLCEFKSFLLQFLLVFVCDMMVVVIWHCSFVTTESWTWHLPGSINNQHPPLSNNVRKRIHILAAVRIYFSNKNPFS